MRIKPGVHGSRSLTSEEVRELNTEFENLRALVKTAETIMEEDVLPQAGVIVFQDYARLNEFMLGAAKI